LYPIPVRKYFEIMKPPFPGLLMGMDFKTRKKTVS
jgi:hypothetical protein